MRVSRFQTFVYFRITFLNQHLAKVKITRAFKNWRDALPVYSKAFTEYVA